MKRQPDESSVGILPWVVLICWLLALCSHPAIGQSIGSDTPSFPENPAVMEAVGPC